MQGHDEFLVLPKDILLKILSYLDPLSLRNVCVAGSAALPAALTSDDALWRPIFENFHRYWKTSKCDAELVDFEPSDTWKIKCMKKALKLSRGTFVDDDLVPRMKLLVTGDGAIGKTCLLIRYTSNRFPTEYIPTVFDHYSANLQVDERLYQVDFWDIPGSCCEDRLRPLYYRDCDIFLCCFSVVNPQSFARVKDVWVPELRKYRHYIPIVLVGLKTDLLSDADALERLEAKGGHPVTPKEARRLAQELHLVGYLSCSSLSGQGVKQVFDTAVATVLGATARASRKSDRHRGKCDVF